MECDIEGNRQLQADEICALESIYEDGLVLTDESSFRIAIPAPTGAHIALAVHLPETYPSAGPPLFELRSDYLPADVLQQLSQELESLFAPGDVVLYNWVEHLRERWQELAPSSQQDEQREQAAAAAAAAAADDDVAELLAQASLGEDGAATSPLPAPLSDEDEALQLAMAEMVERIVHGEPYTEKKSTFQAHLAPVTNLQQVKAVVEILLQNNKIRAATHNIMAYRIAQPEKGTFQQDSDDDGEAAAGGRLLHLLQMVDARNVVVVVSRWFGGVLLGPARFGLINRGARELLDQCGFIGGGNGSGGGGKGKGKGGGKK